MKLSVREITLFGMLGAVMYCSKILMEFLPNIHLLGTLTIAYTLTFRKKALYPIYIYVLLNGLFAGFSMWWIPYLYVWTVLWAVTMLLPKKCNRLVYMLVCSTHGFLFGTLYAPAQALMFGLNFKGMIAWIVAGFPFDCIQGVGNLFAGILIVPIATMLKRANQMIQN
ncbi:MAG: hypothetical protein IJC02_07465 [Lachnospiraceae bacterium]|nr:hypothetical protein [Lachnospiraceae bacterium]MBQ6993156.1 hypothetical protein [Lachnospiraceae bacterium]